MYSYLKYHGSSYAEDAWDVFWYEKNLQGDIVAVYNDTGTKLATYYYDAFGYCIASYDNNGSSTRAYYNPFRYRGYYYDKDLDLYYLNARYYDGRTGRFISPDYPDVVTATPGALTDKNLYAYCDNNPVMRRDDSGEWWNVIAGAAIGASVNFITSFASAIWDGEIEDEEFWQIVVSTLIGGLEGAAMSIIPSASTYIGAFSGVAESVINDCMAHKDWKRVIANAFVSGFMGAAGGVGGSDFAKGGKILNDAMDSRKMLKLGNLHPNQKKVANKSIKSAKNYLKKSMTGSLSAGAVDLVIMDFSDWTINAIVNRKLER